MDESLDFSEDENLIQNEEKVDIVQVQEEEKQEKDSSKENEEKRSYESGSKTYTPYHPVQENLESNYFPPGVLGFAKPSTGEAFVNPDVYGEMREVVKLHERLHLMYPHLDETSIRVMTNNLSGGPYVPTGRAY